MEMESLEYGLVELNAHQLNAELDAMSSVIDDVIVQDDLERSFGTTDTLLIIILVLSTPDMQ